MPHAPCTHMCSIGLLAKLTAPYFPNILHPQEVLIKQLSLRTGLPGKVSGTASKEPESLGALSFAARPPHPEPPVSATETEISLWNLFHPYLTFKYHMLFLVLCPPPGLLSSFSACPSQLLRNTHTISLQSGQVHALF